MILHSAKEAAEFVAQVEDAALRAQKSISELSRTKSGTDFLREIKFFRAGFDPLNTKSQWNFVEQLNQTFTYLASFRAAEMLFEWHPGLETLEVNLGTAAGSDLASDQFGGIAAEVFAATSPSSNRKLQKDIQKVLSTEAMNKYVFFSCPNIQVGKYEANCPSGVFIWSLGC